MKHGKIYTILRTLFGLWLIVSGIGFFVPIFPQPELASDIGQYVGALAAAGYIMPVMGIIFLVAGALLIINRYIALSAVVLFPLSVNIVLTHAFLDPATIVPGLVFFLLNIYIAWANSDKYRPLFEAR